MSRACAVRLGVALLAILGASTAAGCIPADQPRSLALASDSRAASDPAAEAPSAWVRLLRSHGIDAAVPSQGKFILVNIPSFELVALQDGMPVLRSRVVVGRPAAATPELLTSMFAVRFNPSWTPTPSMVRNEGLHSMPPGPQNPLGRIMFDLDNDEFIYLHDTNERALFDRSRRALSHGCVRVERARDLAAWALDISNEEIDAMIARGTTFSVPLPEAIPVSLAYHTRFPDEHGLIASYADIYGGQATAAAAAEQVPPTRAIGSPRSPPSRE